MRFDVIGLGIAACDYLTVVDRFPAADEKVRSETLVIEGGGTVGTALVTMARLGLKTAFAGSVGEDDFGRFILRGLETEGVDTSLARVVAGARSPFAFCVATPPHRNVFSVRPTTPPIELRPSDLDALLDTRFLHLDGTEERASLELARAARKRAVGVSLDLQRGRPGTEELLACADIAAVSESFAHERYPNRTPLQAAREMWRPEMQIAAITLGARGAVATVGGEPFEVPAEAIEVVDSTGAGDAFHGALVAGMLRGLSPERALAFATHVAALSCREIGGRAGLPSLDELGDWM